MSEPKIDMPPDHPCEVAQARHERDEAHKRVDELETQVADAREKLMAWKDESISCPCCGSEDSAKHGEDCWLVGWLARTAPKDAEAITPKEVDECVEFVRERVKGTHDEMKPAHALDADELLLVWKGEHQSFKITNPPTCANGVLVVLVDSEPTRSPQNVARIAPKDPGPARPMETETFTDGPKPKCDQCDADTPVDELHPTSGDWWICSSCYAKLFEEPDGEGQRP